MAKAERARKGGEPPRFLWLVFLIPALFLIVGANSAYFRYDQARLAEQTDVTVYDVEHETYSYRDSDGRTRSGEHWRYSVEFEADGETRQRYVVEPNWDLEMVWHNSDSIDPDVYAAGARMPALLRRDLDYAVAHDDFWAIYSTPVFLLGFGFFALLICSPVIFILRNPMPRMPEMKREQLLEELRKRKDAE